MQEADLLRGTTGWREEDRGTLAFTCRCGRQLVLVPGENQWFDPASQHHPAHLSLFNLLALREKIPHHPGAILRIVSWLATDNDDGAGLEALTRADPFLRAVLYARLGQQSPADGPLIRDAASPDLRHEIRLAALRSFEIQYPAYSSHQFFEDGEVTRRLIRRLLVHTGQLSLPGELIELAGALANTGKLVMAMAFPRDLDPINQLVNGPADFLPWQKAEERLGLPAHRILGQLAAVLWGWHPWLVRSMEYLYEPPPEEEELATECTVVALANQLCYKVQLENDQMEPGLVESLANSLNLSPEETDSLLEQVAHEHQAA